MEKTISSLLMIPVLALGLDSCRDRTYNIDGNKVTIPEKGLFAWEMKEIKPSGEEIYYFGEEVHITDSLSNFKRYSSGSPVFEQAMKREKYVLKKIDSIKNSEIQKDLEVLKK